MDKEFEKQTIYEIFRACRLCGAGGGYKMPIIQNVVDLDDTDVELKQKIRECVQVEVHTDDKMPPLICELCIDKINDFYEFLEMCRQTNERTRLRLGLPPQKALRVAKTEPEEDNCILGMTEPIRDDDSEDEPLSRPPQKKIKKGKKTPEVVIRKCNVKIETSHLSLKPKPVTKTKEQTKTKELIKAKDIKVKPKRLPSRSPSPPTKMITRQQEDDIKSKTKLNDKSKLQEKDSKASPKGILKSGKREVEIDDVHELLTPRKKRSAEPVKSLPSKKVKISPPPKPRAPSPKPNLSCNICSALVKGQSGLSNHLRVHIPTFTNPKLACNACYEWFTTAEEANSHHRKHKNGLPYQCERCDNTYKLYAAFTDHFAREPCDWYEEVPDIKCDECWFEFATQYLYLQHRCPGQDGRKGGKCSKCSKSYSLMKNLVKHEAACTYRKKGEVYIEPEIQKRLLKMQVRIAKCDPLLKKSRDGHYDVALVPSSYGVDPTRVYPYIRIKRELHDSMVNIHYDTDDIHWESDYSDTSDTLLGKKSTKVDSLSTLSLKVIFSAKGLGRIPRKRRKIKREDAFDSLVNNEGDTSIKRDIDSIIAGLDSAWDDEKLVGDGDTNSLSILDMSSQDARLRDMDATDNRSEVEDGHDKVDEHDSTHAIGNNETGVKDSNDYVERNRDSDDAQNSKMPKVIDERNDVDSKVQLDEVQANGDTKDPDDRESQTFAQNDDALTDRNDSDNVTNNSLDALESMTFTQVDDVSENTRNDDVCEKTQNVTKSLDGDSFNSNDDNVCTEANNDEHDNKIAENRPINVENPQDNSGNTENDNVLHSSEVVSNNARDSDDKFSADDKVRDGTLQNGAVNNVEAYDNDLMDALDAQITANDSDNKIAKLDNRISNEKDKSMDLECISDEEFNFD